MACVQISDFYAHKSVFITGGTGFIGKILIEKLLYHCRNIQNIYVLMRDKKGVSGISRFKEVINCADKSEPYATLPHRVARSRVVQIKKIFCRLREEAPHLLDKMIPILGNICQPCLGISDTNLEVLQNEVSVVFHAAASVNFNETLRDAFAHNLVGTREVMNFCHRMNKLQALVHVSTAYTAGNRFFAEEILYPPPTDIATAEYLASKDFDESLTTTILGKYPNTYTYTKALAEHLIATTHGDIPVAIVRPSIVTSSLHGPIKGWVENWNGANGLTAAFLMGGLRCILGNDECISDLVPVDMVANLMIVSATRLQSAGQLTVYNCCTGCSNPITWGEYLKLVCISSWKNLEGFTFPYMVITRKYYVYSVISSLFQSLPAHILNFSSRLIGKKSRALYFQNKIRKLVQLTQYFTSNQWLFVDSNVRNLMRSLSPDDRRIFDFDVSNINWDAYVDDYILGLKKYLLKIK